jgi:RNA polymerase sigma factor (sigma-70 family)
VNRGIKARGPAPPTISDVVPLSELVKAAADGDSAAWEALVERFSGLVWSITRAYRLSPADAADVSQTTWLRLVEHLGRLREPERVGSWIATTVKNECLRVQRLAGRQVPSEDIKLETPPPDLPGADSALLTLERDAALWRAFSALSERCQALLRLLIADPPLSYEEVARILDMPIGSIGPTRQRCLDRLRRKAEVEGINTDTEGLIQ